jgi:hypothetical protein
MVNEPRRYKVKSKRMQSSPGIIEAPCKITHYDPKKKRGEIYLLSNGWKYNFNQSVLGVEHKLLEDKKTYHALIRNSEVLAVYEGGIYDQKNRAMLQLKQQSEELKEHRSQEQRHIEELESELEKVKTRQKKSAIELSELKANTVREEPFWKPNWHLNGDLLRRPDFKGQGNGLYILPLEKSSVPDSLRIQALAELQKIQRLCHFTHISNISSILEYGLFSAQALHRSEITYRASDHQRLGVCRI